MLLVLYCTDVCPSLKGRDDYDNVRIHAQMFQTDPSVMSELGPALVGSSNGLGCASQAAVSMGVANCFDNSCNATDCCLWHVV